jgi:hypothetical protein
MLKNCPNLLKKYHMIKKLLLLLLLIVFVNPILLKLSKELSNVELRQLLYKKNRVDSRKPDGVKTGDIMIVTIAQKRER